VALSWLAALFGPLHYRRTSPTTIDDSQTQRSRRMIGERCGPA